MTTKRPSGGFPWWLGVWNRVSDEAPGVRLGLECGTKDQDGTHRVDPRPGLHRTERDSTREKPREEMEPKHTEEPSTD